jgi:predicted phosphodiesterase
MSSAGEARITEVVGFLLEHGEAKTIETFAITAETLARYMRAYKERYNPDLDRLKLLNDIAERFSPSELDAILSSADGIEFTRTNVHLPECDYITLGILSDTHIGSVDSDASQIFWAFDEFAKAGVDRVLHLGDVTEGMSRRQGHIYGLAEDGIGFAAQKKKAIAILRQWTDSPMDLIDGNHDRWFLKSNGAIIVEDICKEIPNANFRGHDEASLWFGNMEFRMWHGEDGAAYAKSYRLQQIVRSLQEDDIPHVLAAGHDHKQGQFRDRGCLLVAPGALCHQSSWMRSTRKQNDGGFCILRLGWDGERIVEADPKMFTLPSRKRNHVHVYEEDV